MAEQTTGFMRDETMEITIRRATADDYTHLCALIDSVDALHRHHLPGIFQAFPEPVRERDYLQGVMDDPRMCLLVAETEPATGSALDSEIVGTVHAMLREPPPIPLFVPRRFAVIDNLVVKRSYRRQGIGRALMEAAGRWATSEGASTVELTVYQFNEEAQAFYERVGYHTESRRMVLQL
jgi:ribosomal protein S18 acetylase RimI-like enzyme